MSHTDKPKRHSKSLKTQKLHVDDLRLGMFVSKLDCDWLDTSFLLQGFTLDSLAQIEEIKKYSAHAWVDQEVDQWVNETGLKNIASGSRVTPKKFEHHDQLSAQEEHHQARAIYTASKQATHNILVRASSGPPVQTLETEQTVHHCVQSILRNPDALLWMSKIRNRDEYTAEHCLNVCILAIAFGRHMKLAEQELYQIGTAGLLHDVGKMRVQPEILNKPGKLTEKEFKAMSAHVIHGRNLLQQTPNIAKEVIEAAHAHHERIDGNGYPRRLKDSDISFHAKVVSIVDVYDAITSHRCYAPARPVTEALKILYEHRGTQFDETLVLAFIQFIGLYPPGSIVELENGMVGLVLATNQDARHMPKIIRVRDQNKAECTHEFIDLSLIGKDELSKDHVIKSMHIDGTFGIYLKDFKAKGLSFAIG